MLTASIDLRKFNDAVARYVDKLHIDSVKVVKDQARLLLTQIIKFTPPKSLAQGRNAVARDLNNAMSPLHADHFYSKSIHDKIEKQDFAGVKEILRNTGKGWASWKLEHFDPSLHKNARDSRGRVPRTKKTFVLEVGDWNKYLKQKQGNVGIAKSGWWPSLAAVGGSAPNYVTKHSNKFGMVDLQLNDPKHPRIRMQNFSDAASSLEQVNHTVESALKVRMHSMEADIKRRIEQGRLE